MEQFCRSIRRQSLQTSLPEEASSVDNGVRALEICDVPYL